MLRKKSAIPLQPGEKDADQKRLALVTYPMYEISSRFPSQIPFFKEATHGHVFLIESATGEEGKTTVLANLGMNMAAAGVRTLLIDYDLHRPRVHQMFGLKNSSGLINAVNRIMSFELSRGNLKECSMDDLFFLINLKKISGVLLVKNESQAQTMAVYFQDGRLLHIQSQNMPESSRLGAMLLNSNVINQHQLADALDRQTRTGQPLGYILINAGYIQRDRLQGPIRLQTEEHLQKLFSWKTGAYTFKPGRATLYNSEKVGFGEDFTRTIEGLGRLEGSRLIENEIVSRLFSTAADNLWVMPAGAALSELRGPVNLPIIAKFLEILKQRFDVILMDTPPLDAATGAAALSKLVDGVLLVVKAGHLSVKKLNQAFGSISRDKIIGAVLNQTKLNKGDYNYKYYK